MSVLASGSRGNCALIATSSTRILVDAGLSGRETFKRLRALGERVEEISAILITHEHSDHVAGLYRLAIKLNVPVFITAPTHHAWKRAASDAIRSGTCDGQRSLLKDQGVTPELPKRERRMLKLRLNGNLELRRIAMLFGVTESRVCQLLRQAAARVRSRLADA